MLLGLALVLAGCAGGPTPSPRASISAGELGPAHYVGEASPESGILWVRCTNAAEAVFTLAPGPDGERRAAIDPERDHTAHIPLEDLAADTIYSYTVRCGAGPVATGTFATPPPPSADRAVRFAWFGDLGGQNVCRDLERGYLPFDTVREARADFLVALGDMVYVDDACLERGRYGNRQIPGPTAPARSVDEFRAHWRYARADAVLQRAFSTAAVYPVWDDHEIRNDAGPHHDTLADAPDEPLLPAARTAFLDYNPIGDAGDAADFHRSVRWGRHLELFILDTRSHRDANFAPDRDGKSMLGAAQREWLLAALRDSDATWKVVVSSVPISVPTGRADARDGWADDGSGLGFESELRQVLEAVRPLDARRMLWITTDVHFGAVIRYTPFADEPDFFFHEIITGPLNAGVFPQEAMDPTFGPERLYLHGPARAEDITSYEEALRWFNFGVIDVDRDGSLAARIVAADGTTAFELRLDP